MKDRKRCVVYTRVSTSMQVDGYSLDAQIDRIETYANLHQMEIVGYYQDAGKSGKSIEGRPDFQKMLSDISEQKLQIDYVLVYKLSRFGRSVSDTLHSLEHMKDFDVNLICVEEGLDTSQTMGKLLITLMSAIAEMERENILEQTMNGRLQKAREGKWNGGFAPYGYKIVNGNLEIAEDEKDAVALIFKKYTETDWGCGKIAKHLNNCGIRKKQRQNGTLKLWSNGMVKSILDNPVYCGKIAYGRRRIKKVKGTQNRYHQERQKDYIVSDGEHKGIVSVEVWEKAQRKRESMKDSSKRIYGTDRANILTGILRCPECGGPMYSSRNSRKDEKKIRYYYKCRNSSGVTGHPCSFNRQLRQEVIDEQVYEAIVKLVDCEQFADAVNQKMGSAVNVDVLEKQIIFCEKECNSTRLSKSRLEQEMDALSADTPHYNRKREDMSKRLDVLYDKLEEQEQYIQKLKRKKENIERDNIQRDMVYQSLQYFGDLYQCFTDAEKKEFMNLLIERIQIYPEALENGQYLKSIDFTFPILYKGEKIENVSWKESMELLMKKEDSTEFIEMKVDIPEKWDIAPKHGATYQQIVQYVLEKHGVKVHTGFIAEVKRKCGLDMRKNYNLQRGGKGTKRKCPKEKEEYIIEALRHFGMV